MALSSPNRKHCGKRRNLLVTKKFSFSHDIFKRLERKTSKNNLGLFGKGLRQNYFPMSVHIIISDVLENACVIFCFIPLHTLLHTESCFRHPLFDLRGTRKVEIRHTNFHFSSKKVASKSRKVEVFDLTIVKKLSTFRPKKAKVEKLKSRKVEKWKS